MAKDKPKLSIRIADMLAGEESVLDKVRRKRIEFETGIDTEETTTEKPNENHARGYTKEKWEE